MGLQFATLAFGDNLPINQYETLRQGLPEADLQLVGDFFHEFVMRKSPEELDCVRKAGQIADQAMQAMIDRIAPGVTEYQLAAAFTGAVMDAGGQIDLSFLALLRWPIRPSSLAALSPRSKITAWGFD